MDNSEKLAIKRNRRGGYFILSQGIGALVVALALHLGQYEHSVVAKVAAIIGGVMILWGMATVSLNEDWRR